MTAGSGPEGKQRSRDFPRMATGVAVARFFPQTPGGRTPGGQLRTSPVHIPETSRLEPPSGHPLPSLREKGGGRYLPLLALHRGAHQRMQTTTEILPTVTETQTSPPLGTGFHCNRVLDGAASPPELSSRKAGKAKVRDRPPYSHPGENDLTPRTIAKLHPIKAARELTPGGRKVKQPQGRSPTEDRWKARQAPGRYHRSECPVGEDPDGHPRNGIVPGQRHAQPLTCFSEPLAQLPLQFSPQPLQLRGHGKPDRDGRWC